MIIMRTLARETLFKYLFSTHFSGEDDNFKSALFRLDKLTEEDVSYCNAVLQIIGEHRQEIAAEIDKCSRSFPQSNIFPADMAILMVAVAEIKYFDDIPYQVSSNEAANIASKYSSEKSAAFINGVLSGVINNG